MNTTTNKDNSVISTPTSTSSKPTNNKASVNTQKQNVNRIDSNKLNNNDYKKEDLLSIINNFKDCKKNFGEIIDDFNDDSEYIILNLKNYKLYIQYKDTNKDSIKTAEIVKWEDLDNGLLGVSKNGTVYIIKNPMQKLKLFKPES